MLFTGSLALPALAGPQSLPALARLLSGFVAVVSEAPEGTRSCRSGLESPATSIRPLTGAEFTAEHIQSGAAGTTLVRVVTGSVELDFEGVTGVPLAAGGIGRIQELLFRAILAVPTEGQDVTAGATNNFYWTPVAGAAGYLIEFTLSPEGFGNLLAVEFPGNTIRVPPGGFTEADGLVRFALPVPAGLAASGTRVQWRVFATDPTGALLKGSIASEASTLTLR